MKSNAFGALCLLGSAGLALYIALANFYPLALGIQDPKARWTKMVTLSPGSLLFHLALILSLFLLYVAACRLALNADLLLSSRRRKVAIGVVVAGWLASSVALWALTPGGESHDIFDYLFRGRMLVEYGGSPLRDTPDQFARAPYLAYITWRDKVDTYGPLWELASAGVAFSVKQTSTAFGHPYNPLPACPANQDSCRLLVDYVLGYRLLATALAGVCGWFIYVLAGRVRPHLALAALAVWLWNPLLLMASAAGAHNDLLMLTSWFAAFWCFQRRWWLAGLLMLGLAMHVKLTAGIVLPAFILWLVRKTGWGHTWRVAVMALVLMAPLSWILYAPFGGWTTLPRMLHERALYVANSPHQLLYRILFEQGWTGSALWKFTIQAPTLLFAVFAPILCLVLLGFRWREHGMATHPPDDALLWRTATALSLLYLVTGSFWFQYWYMLWVLAPAALTPADRFTRSVLPWLTFGALSAGIVGDYLPLLAGQPLNRTQRVATTVALIWLPAVGAWVLARRGGRSPVVSEPLRV